MNKNIANNYLVRKSATRDEFYTTPESACRFLSPLGDAGAYAKKHIFCNCDGPESEIYKILKKNFLKWDLASLEACLYNKDGFGKHTLYNKYPDEDIVEILPDNGSYDSPSSLEILGRSDLVITNPPFSKQDLFIKMMMDLGKKFSIICNQMNLMHIPTREFLINGKFKLVATYPGSATFIHAGGHEAHVNVISVSNLDNIDNSCWFPHRIPKMTKQQLLDKGVLYHPDGYPDNHFEVKYLKNIPTDLREDEVVWTPIIALLAPWYINHYSVLKEMYYNNKKME